MNRLNQNDFLPGNSGSIDPSTCVCGEEAWMHHFGRRAVKARPACNAHHVNSALTMNAANYTYLGESSPPKPNAKPNGAAQWPSTIFLCCRRCVPKCSGIRSGSAFSPRTSPILTRRISSLAIWLSRNLILPAGLRGRWGRSPCCKPAPRTSRPRRAAATVDQNKRAGFQTRPAGNAVSLEDEMMKVSANQMDYAAVTSLYSKSLHLLKTAIGKG